MITAQHACTSCSHTVWSSDIANFSLSSSAVCALICNRYTIDGQPCHPHCIAGSDSDTLTWDRRLPCDQLYRSLLARWTECAIACNSVDRAIKGTVQVRDSSGELKCFELIRFVERDRTDNETGDCADRGADEVRVEERILVQG